MMLSRKWNYVTENQKYVLSKTQCVLMKNKITKKNTNWRKQITFDNQQTVTYLKQITGPFLFNIGTYNIWL